MAYSDVEEGYSYSSSTQKRPLLRFFNYYFYIFYLSADRPMKAFESELFSFPLLILATEVPPRGLERDRTPVETPLLASHYYIDNSNQKKFQTTEQRHQ